MPELPEVEVTRLSLADGSQLMSAPLAVADASSSMRGATLGKGILWLAFGELYGVDLLSGELRYRWP